MLARDARNSNRPETEVPARLGEKLFTSRAEFHIVFVIHEV